MLSDLWIRVRSLLRRKRVEAELDDELRFHLDRQIEKYVKSGMSPDEARRQARIAMGGVEQTKEECRDARGVRLLERLIHDVFYGLRQLRRDPAFTLIAVLGLALGIAVNTAIFSVVDWALFRSLAVSHPSQITLLAFQQKQGSIEMDFSYPEYEAIRRQTRAVFSEVLGYDEELDGLAVNGTAEQVLVAYVTGNFFPVLGLKPAIGRSILPRDGQAGSTSPVLVLSFSYWQRHFGGDPKVLGKQVSVNGQSVTIVGVAPEGFDGINAALDIQGYLPFGLRAAEAGQSNLIADWHRHPLELLGRLRPDTNLAQARAVLGVVAQRLSTLHPKTEDGLALRAFPEWEARSGPDPDHTTQKVSILFLILGALVLLLACVNVANLLFVRATVREREMAVRAALGAGRWTLVRQFVTESVLLAVLGGFAGLWLGMWGIWALRSIPLHTSLPVHFGFGLDWDVLYYTLGVALASGAIVGIVPALRASRVNLNDVLHNGGRTGSARRHRLRGVLVAAQVGASLTLLIVAGLFARSLGNAQNATLGFDPGGVVNFSMNPEAAGYSKARGLAFYQRLLDRTRALPGVTSASLAFSVPLGYFSNGATLQIPGYQPRPGLPPPEVAYNTVTPGYFETLRIPLVRGRDFSISDDKNGQAVAIVNRAMARRFWPHEGAVGRQFTLTGSRQRTVRIVGVVENSRTENLTAPYRPYFYLPLAQDYQSLETLQVRTQGTPGTTIREIEGEIRALAPTMPVFDVQTMSEALNTWHGLLLFRLAAGLTVALGILGLLLALVGVYGVMSYSTSQRTHEIGIRMALGAQTGEVLGTILRQGLAIVGVGMAVGIVAAIAVSRLVASFLVGVTGTDPLTYASVCVALGAVALLACYIPARRAIRVDPTTALRHE